MQTNQIIYFGTHWPQFQSSASSVRTVNLLRSLLHKLSTVTTTTVANNNSNDQHHDAEPQQQQQVLIMCSPQKLTNAKLKASLQTEFSSHRLDMCTQPINEHLSSVISHTGQNHIGHLNPKIAIFDTFVSEEYYGRYLRQHFPHCFTICDTQDIRSLRFLRESSIMDCDVSNIMFHDFDRVKDRTLTKEKEQWLFSNEYKQLFPGVNHELFLRELSSIWKCDASLVVSSREIEFLTRVCRVPSEKLLLSPFISTNSPNSNSGSNSSTTTIVPFHKRRHFIHIGSFRHPPNRDAVLVLKYHLWPKIRSRLIQLNPEDAESAQLHIYGSYTSQEFIDLDDRQSGFRIKKLLPSIEMMQRYRVNLAPLRFGAGIKGKIADGWSQRTPCVSTWIGAEGMHFPPSFPFAGLVAEHSWDEFVDHCIALYTKEQVWNEHSDMTSKITASPESFLSNEKSSDLLSQYLDEHLFNKGQQQRPADYTTAAFRAQDQHDYLSKYLALKKQLQNQRSQTK